MTDDNMAPCPVCGATERCRDGRCKHCRRAYARARCATPAHNATPIGTVRIRRNPRTGEPKEWVKVAEPSKWRPVSAVARGAAPQTT